MPDLKDGESTTVQGSARTPYVLKNVAGVYSCSCPAWRNQSRPIDQRTCKHLRQLRGDEAEQARLGDLLPAAGKSSRKQVKAPPLLLAERWDNHADLTDWWISEKLDGVRAYWDGQQFLSRNGNRYHAPKWFTNDLPNIPLDGELWLDRKQFQRTVSIVRRRDAGELWRELSFVVFDVPGVDSTFETRREFVAETLRAKQPPYARALSQSRCRSLDHLRSMLTEIESLGGEGLMLRQPGSRYEAGRSQTLLKVKTFHDAEARVVAHVAGRGRHKGRMGALAVVLPDGTEFSLGTGFTDRQREQPPPVGSTVTFRYQELTDGGVPRFPSFVGVRHELDKKTTPSQSNAIVFKETTAMSTRRFEYVGGNSAKFWEVSVDGGDVVTRYGRLGTDGQTNRRPCDDPEAATKHAEKLVAQKLKKGYEECAAT